MRKGVQRMKNNYTTPEIEIVLSLDQALRLCSQSLYCSE